ncbi:MAG TPA: dTMP kinase [Gammaproteobacteria bacterium]
MTARGAFITLEGVEGVGKSTNAEFAAHCLRSLGRRVLVTREPGGTALGEQIREWILHGEHGRLSADVETLLMFAARSQHLERVIRPALASGRWVVCDRFTDATWAYQGGGRGADRALLEALTRAVQGPTVPDLTLLLDAPFEVGAGRIRGRRPDHFEREDRAFFTRVRDAYLALAREQPGRIKVLDASRPLEEVQRDIERELLSFNERFGTDA